MDVGTTRDTTTQLPRSVRDNRWISPVDNPLFGRRTGSYASPVPDLNWRTTIRRAVVVRLYGNGRAEIGAAMNLSRILGLARIDGGHMGVRLLVQNQRDIELLVSETQSWTDSLLPGALDLAFESCLPEGDWPVFSFELPGENADTVAM